MIPVMPIIHPVAVVPVKGWTDVERGPVVTVVIRIWISAAVIRVTVTDWISEPDAD
jgi:hypothetical protein